MAILAAVDIGANSVRLKIARVVRKRLEVLHEDREVVRLGESVFRTGALSPEAMELTVRLLRRFQKAAQAHGVTSARVVATSALRDANNGAAFVQWVQAAIGWKVEVISGLEEGRLIHLGVTANTRPSAGRTLLIDLGGGSCELIVSNRGQIERLYSLPLGAVRLTREFLKHDPPTDTELDQMSSYISEEVGRLRQKLTEHKIQHVVATSGTPAALREVYNASLEEPQADVPRAALFRITHKLSTLDTLQRRALRGVGPRRAEIIVAGAHVFAELFTALELESFRYLPFGLRDGLLAQMAEDAANIGLRQKLDDERQNSIQNLAEHYGVDERFAQRVAEHVQKLFKLLAPVHRLPAEYAGLLHAAAMLHEVGSFINRAGRRRHAWYILAHSELLGFSPAQRRMVAALARYLGKSKIVPTSQAVRLLTPADRVLLPRGVALLRLARALEQGRRGAVLTVKAKLTAHNVLLTLETKSAGAELELWALEKERAYFFEIFGRELSCAEA
ncbi:MAG: Ppx/GppA phosphatase family protein [Acidobacteriota bacterium]|nr:Ppx/GppA phosphatase family protein [Acidobacteriota bacterium]